MAFPWRGGLSVSLELGKGLCGRDMVVCGCRILWEEIPAENHLALIAQMCYTSFQGAAYGQVFP